MSNIKFYAPVDFDDTSSGLTIDGDLTVDTNTFFVDVSTNRVGIGTTSPQDLLHLSASSPVLRLTNTSDTGKSSIEFWDNQSGTSQSGEVFYDDSSNLFGLQANANGIVFRASNTFPGSELMRLTSSGNLGIGTSSPSATLNVYNTASAPKAIFQHGTTDHLSILIGTSGGGIAVEDNNDFSIFHQDYTNRAGETGLTTRFRINSSGNVGIGTTSPDYKLDVEGDIQINETLIAKSGADLVLQARSGQVVGINSNGTRTMTLNASNNVGIGTTSPDQKLHVVGNAKVTGVFYTDYVQTLGGTSIDFRHQDASTIMRVDTANARVGIGTTSPGAPLEIATTGTGDSLLITNTDATSSASPVITLNRNSASPADADYLGQIKFKGENDTSGSIVYAKITAKISDASAGTEDGLIETAIHSNSSNVIVSRQTGTDLKLINGVGLQVDGDVGIGTTSPSAKLEVIGNVNVGAGAADNYLQAKHSDSTYTRVHGYGLYMSRSASYIRPTTDNTQNLYIGTSDKQWDFLSFDASTTTFSVNGSESLRVNSSGWRS